MIRFFLVANRQGRVRLARHYGASSHAADARVRRQRELEVVSSCVARDANSCPYLDVGELTVVYRCYASLYFIVGVEAGTESELLLLELIAVYVEALDAYFDGASEAHILASPDVAHLLLDELLVNGHVVETSVVNLLRPLRMMEGPGADV